MSEYLPEFLFGNSSLLQDRLQKRSLERTGMDRDRYPTAVRMPERQMGALVMVVKKTSLAERAGNMFGRRLRQSAHA